MTLDDYIEKRLLMASCTSFVDENGNTQMITTEDGNARCSPSHTLPDKGSMTFSNTNHRKLPEDDPIGFAMVEFYRNSLAAGEPLTANAIICNDMVTFPYKLKRIKWPHDSFFLFNERTGLLTDKWWHIYGCFPL